MNYTEIYIQLFNQLKEEVNTEIDTILDKAIAKDLIMYERDGISEDDITPLMAAILHKLSKRLIYKRNTMRRMNQYLREPRLWDGQS